MTERSIRDLCLAISEKGVGTAVGDLFAARLTGNNTVTTVDEYEKVRLPDGIDVVLLRVAPGGLAQLVLTGRNDEAAAAILAAIPGDDYKSGARANMTYEQTDVLAVYSKGKSEPYMIDVSELGNYTVVINNDGNVSARGFVEGVTATCE